MWCGSSSPLMETLRASLSVVLGSGQTSEDKKLSAEFSLKSQIRVEEQRARNSFISQDRMRDVVTTGVLPTS